MPSGDMSGLEQPRKLISRGRLVSRGGFISEISHLAAGGFPGDSRSLSSSVLWDSALSWRLLLALHGVEVFLDVISSKHPGPAGSSQGTAGRSNTAGPKGLLQKERKLRSEELRPALTPLSMGCATIHTGLPLMVSASASSSQALCFGALLEFR